MRKLRLELENLAVESFETDRASGFAGTVQGRQGEDPFAAASAPNPCLPATLLTCPRRNSEYASCIVNCECTNGQRACLPGPDTP
jgi:hypothetical protein